MIEAQGTPYFPGCYDCVAPPETSSRRLVVVWVAAIAVVAAGLLSLSGVLAQPLARYKCPPDCGRPPMGDPVAINPRFTAPDGAFSVSYPPDGYQVSTGTDGVTAELLSGDGGTLRLHSVPANGRSAQSVATELVHTTYPDAAIAYQIPNVSVGYQPGYGVAADYWPQGMAASYARIRILIMVAVKNDLALVASAVGPYHQFAPDFGPGRPSAAGLEVALDMGKYVNSFQWRGDPAR